MSLRYLKHSGAITWAGRLVEYRLYLVGPQVVDADGTLDGEAFDSLNELARLARWDEATAKGFAERFQEVVSIRA